MRNFIHIGMKERVRQNVHAQFSFSHFLVLSISLLLSCGGQEKAKDATAEVAVPENREAKAMLQGVWQDRETEMPVLRAIGDTIFFADANSQPEFFRVAGDSLLLGDDSYFITKLNEYNFCFQNATGEEIQLTKHDESFDEPVPDFSSDEPKVINTTEVVNVDSVVMYGGKRYHWYVTVNPTRNRVTRTTFNTDGMAVEKVYFDNIIHVSVFKQGQRLFTRDFNKRAFAADVPEEFMQQAILGNIRYSHTDADGLHFEATVCLPDGESCYLIETLVGLNGQLSFKLMDH